MSRESTFKFDVFLACLFPLALFLIAVRVNGPSPKSLSWNTIRRFFTLRNNRGAAEGMFSLNQAYQSYLQYGQLSREEIAHRHASYNMLGRSHKRLGTKIGYLTKLDKLTYVTELNATLTQRVAELAEKELGVGHIYHPEGRGDLGRVREALKHFIRDWSSEGAVERDRIFSPILDVLKEVPSGERPKKRVLVPGSGLGRLAWEISQLGFDTTANEFSYFMTLAFRFLLSPETTHTTSEHILRPYAHWFSHQRSNGALFRAIPFPDTVPRLSPNLRLIEGDFLRLPSPGYTPAHSLVCRKEESPSPEEKEAGYDYVVTLFFIDTSLNVFETLEKIYSLLKPGGTWINLGPLLWTSGGQAKVELSLDEVIDAAKEIGFDFTPSQEGDDSLRKQRSIECEYTGDQTAMMRWIYKAEFWVATKP